MSALACPVCGAEARHLFAKDGYEVGRCRACGLGFVANLPSAEELERFYAESYYDASTDRPGYHSEYGELEDGLKHMYRGFLEQVEKRHPGKRFERVLDVGCAYGFFLDTARERWQPNELVGLDVTPEAEEHARRKGYAFHRGFLEDVALPERHFDLVFMGDAFEHVRDPHRVAETFERVLAPDGALVITTVDFDAWLPRLLGARWRLMTPPEHLFFWNRRSLLTLFGEHGLGGEIENYWLYYPKGYVRQRFAGQFGFPPFFLALWPSDRIPIWSFDVLIAYLRRSG